MGRTIAARQASDLFEYPYFEPCDGSATRTFQLGRGQFYLQFLSLSLNEKLIQLLCSLLQLLGKQVIVVTQQSIDHLVDIRLVRLAFLHSSVLICPDVFRCSSLYKREIYPDSLGKRSISNSNQRIVSAQVNQPTRIISLETKKARYRSTGLRILAAICIT